MKVDLPALGKPSRPTSASSLSSRRSARVSPSPPGVERRGERLIELLKCMLPRPPLPPRATSRRSPLAVRSPMISSVSTLCTTVPTGTTIVMSSPPLPYIWRPMPFSPRLARNIFSWRKSTSVLRFSSACRYTSPPLPPSPPSGPPSGMNFSRRKLMEPLPPFPAITVMSASSTSFMDGPCGVCRLQKQRTPPERGSSHTGTPNLLDDAHGAALLRTLGRELDLAVHEREQRVVAAEADARTRVELRAALANDDVAGFDGLATVQLDAQVLRVGVAAVARRTYALFMCHGCCSLLLVATGNAGDLDFGVMLPVAHLLAMVLAAAELHDAHLVGAAVALDGGGDAGALERVAKLDAFAVAEHEHVVERDLLAGFDVEQFDAQRLALHHAVLLTAGDQYCVHDQTSSVVIVVALTAFEGGQP